METQSAAYFNQQVIQEMGKHLQAPAWSVKQKLALTCQMLASEGHESGLDFGACRTAWELLDTPIRIGVRRGD